MSIALRIAIALCVLSTACTPEGEPMPIGGRTVRIHAGPIDVTATDARRTAIADRLQRALEDDLEQPLQLEISSLRERDGWAFATLYPRTPEGAQIDWMRTHYADERRAGILEDDTTYVLLQRRGDAWKVRELSIGSPDNAWMDWGREHGAPKEIFWLAGG